ncbi:hypothetical protein [Sphingobium tyrosinilyticum]|uniref:Uncharacterized protein n=1 Tax=Sphingobium tyrosinilyticum TaxID=2715436 RepID=A0ABV9EZ46_9SPHN
MSFAKNVQARLLNALFDAAHPMSVTELQIQLRVTRRDLWSAVRAQAVLGNVRKGQPLELTAAARAAIAAGRSAQPAAAAA